MWKLRENTKTLSQVSAKYPVSHFVPGALGERKHPRVNHVVEVLLRPHGLAEERAGHTNNVSGFSERLTRVLLTHLFLCCKCRYK